MNWRAPGTWGLIACLVASAGCRSSRSGISFDTAQGQGGTGRGGGSAGRDASFDRPRDVAPDQRRTPDAQIVDVVPPFEVRGEVTGIDGNGGIHVDAQVPIETGPRLDGPGDARTDARPDAAPKKDTTPLTYWRPAVGASWDWQLAVPIKPDVDVQIYAIDLFDNPASVLTALRARGRRVICHVDLGAWESGRPDAERFPADTLGSPVNGNPNRRWLDVRNISGLLGMLRGRLDLAVSKGCDAVAPDHLDGWDTRAHETTGFPLTSIDQLIYNRTIAAEAHARQLAVGLRGNVRQVSDLVDDFDFHISENCYMRGDCGRVLPFIQANKPVFDVEYTLPLASFCPMAKRERVSAIRKRVELNNDYREACPP